MTARPVIKAASGGAVRHLTQTVVIFTILLISTAAATLGMALLANSSGPFDRAFAAQHGAHVAATVHSARVTVAQLAATSKLPGVTGAAGPFPDVTLQMTQPAPVTPGCLDVAASCAAVARAELTVAATSAPCCAANA